LRVFITPDNLRFFFNRLRERLWIKPLVISLLCVGGAFVAKLADDTFLSRLAPEVSAESVESLLAVMASSMMVIATLAVASMVSAYASASTTATPRSFKLIIADDVSQNALSTFIGAFIFSIVALTSVKNQYFGPASLFALFAVTVLVFAVVILTFVRWVDRIARLGRMGTTIDTVEAATARALARRRDAPCLGGVALDPEAPRGRAVFTAEVGYVQHVDVSQLQAWAEEGGGRVAVAALPGAFVTPDRPLAYVAAGSGQVQDLDDRAISSAFVIGGERQFDDDPRFGLVVLGEIASRALSPAVNDPGTAIEILGRLIRLFVLWSEQPAEDPEQHPRCDRVAVPTLAVADMFDDAFTSIARDGAGLVEVAIRLQKALAALALVAHPEIQEAARHHARQALTRSEQAMTLAADIAAVRSAWGKRAP